MEGNQSTPLSRRPPDPTIQDSGYGSVSQSRDSGDTPTQRRRLNGTTPDQLRTVSPNRSSRPIVEPLHFDNRRNLISDQPSSPRFFASTSTPQSLGATQHTDTFHALVGSTPPALASTSSSSSPSHSPFPNPASSQSSVSSSSTRAAPAKSKKEKLSTTLLKKQLHRGLDVDAKQIFDDAENVASKHHTKQLAPTTLARHDHVKMLLELYLKQAGQLKEGEEDLSDEEIDLRYFSPGGKLLTKPLVLGFVKWLASSLEGRLGTPEDGATSPPPSIQYLKNLAWSCIAMYRERTGTRFSLEDRTQVINYIEGDLKTELKLESRTRPKPITTLVDLLRIVSATYADKTPFRVPRERVQFTAAMLTILYCACRPGEPLLAELHTDALKYKDLKFSVLGRGTGSDDPPALVILEIKIRNLKGKRNKPDEFKSAILTANEEIPGLDPLLHFTAIASQDSAFAGNITLDQIWNARYPQSQHVEIPLKPELGETFVFRAFENRNGQLHLTEKGERSKRFTTLFRKVTDSAGFKDHLTGYALRRQTANVFNTPNHTQADLKAALGHNPNSLVYSKYQTKVIRMDTQALIEGREENTEVRNQVNALPVYTTRITSISPDAKIKILASADVVAEDAKVESAKRAFESARLTFPVPLTFDQAYRVRIPEAVALADARNARNYLIRKMSIKVLKEERAEIADADLAKIWDQSMEGRILDREESVDDPVESYKILASVDFRNATPQAAVRKIKEACGVTPALHRTSSDDDDEDEDGTIGGEVDFEFAEEEETNDTVFAPRLSEMALTMLGSHAPVKPSTVLGGLALVQALLDPVNLLTCQSGSYPGEETAPLGPCVRANCSVTTTKDTRGSHYHSHRQQDLAASWVDLSPPILDDLPCLCGRAGCDSSTEVPAAESSLHLLSGIKQQLKSSFATVCFVDGCAASLDAATFEAHAVHLETTHGRAVSPSITIKDVKDLSQQLTRFCYACYGWFHGNADWYTHLAVELDSLLSELEEDPTVLDPIVRSNIVNRPGYCLFCLPDETLGIEVRMKQFVARSTLGRHLRKHFKKVVESHPVVQSDSAANPSPSSTSTLDAPVDSDNEPIKCPACSREFQLPEAFGKHLVDYHQLRPFGGDERSPKYWNGTLESLKQRSSASRSDTNTDSNERSQGGSEDSPATSRAAEGASLDFSRWEGKLKAVTKPILVDYLKSQGQATRRNATKGDLVRRIAENQDLQPTDSEIDTLISQAKTRRNRRAVQSLESVDEEDS